MRNLADTLARLRQFRTLAPFPAQPYARSVRLTELHGFGSNPGQLRAFAHIPAHLPKNAPLVLVLHGCTQTAAGYDEGSGWSRLADKAGFAVVFAEQTSGNNPNRCFNWFVPEDTGRERGEALSIRQMVGAMVSRHDLDSARVYVTGLSAGAAMTAVMLATYPEVFAGGAVIAGLPYGVASTVPQAFDRMRGHGAPDAGSLQALVRNASGGFKGPWPSLSIWHGSADATVSVSNADALIAQWHEPLGVAAEASEKETAKGVTHRRWRDETGRVRLEEFRIAGMGHGTPVAPAEGCGIAAPFMLDVGVCSTRHIAAFWGLLGAVKLDAAAATAAVATNENVKAASPAAKSASTRRVAKPRRAISAPATPAMAPPLAPAITDDGLGRRHFTAPPGLSPEPARGSDVMTMEAPVDVATERTHRPPLASLPPDPLRDFGQNQASSYGKIRKIIEDALRAAGLMK